MSDRREIQSLLQRTAPDPLGAPYARPPADLPPGPPAGADEFLGMVVDGTANGQDKIYPTYADSGKDYGLGWYVREVDPITKATFSGDRGLVTVYNQGYSAAGNGFWPIPFGWIVRVARRDNYWETWVPPVSTLAQYTDAWSVAEWHVWGMGLSGISVDVACGTFTPGYGALYPDPRNGALILLSPYYSPIVDGSVIQWFDATPRIRLNAADRTSAPTERLVNVETDFGDGGIVWILDTDT